MRHPELVGADLDPPARCTRGNPVRQAYATHVLCATDICNKVNGGEAGIRSRQVSAKHRFAIFCSVASRHLDPRGCGYPEDTPAVEPYGFSSLAGRYSMCKHGVRGSIKSGGEAGIRTLDTLLAHTRFPIVLLRPARTPLRVQRLRSATQKYKPKQRNSSTGS